MLSGIRTLETCLYYYENSSFFEFNNDPHDKPESPMEITNSRSTEFLDLLNDRIAILDGAMGTMVHTLGLDEQGFRGKPFQDHGRDLKNCIDVLTLSHQMPSVNSRFVP